MILPFSTQLNGKPTYFVEKIQKALRLPYFKDSVGFSPDHVPPNMNFYVKSKCNPKLHTIREDKTNRWKPGTKIDFFINCRQPTMFRFAPVIPVVSVQKVEIIHQEYLNDIIIKIDGIKLNIEGIRKLAYNDGFESLMDFLIYFNEDFTGKLIHWTDKRY